ncbi:unnamed protein product [Prunus brigantina]
MRWHKEKRVEDDVMRHPADGEAWKAFDRTFPEFAAEPRNVRLGLATDGFNPYGVLNQHHSTWPIFVFPYNLPPWKCMKKEYMMMTVLITEDPGRSIDVYLRPLVDELKDLWTNGVRTYDKSTGKMFTLRAAVMWTVNDFPAYAMVSGWSTKGYMACPVCKEDVTSGWHAGKVCYLGHRRWLSWDHEWREKDKQFDGNTERRLRPREWSGDEILDQLNRLDFAPFGKTVSRTRPSTHLNWTHKSMLLLGELKKTVRNRAKPEGSIIEAWVQYESLNFCGMYLKDVDTAFNRPQRNNDGGCHVNGVKFLGTARDDKLCTQNNGVHVPGGGESTDIDFYGKLTTVVQLLYKDRYQVIMFKCRWFDTNPNRQGSVKIDHGLLSVNINRTWYDDDPYILANMATQIVYLDDPKSGNGWKVVQKMDQRNVYAIPELDPTDNEVDNVADQRFESSMENDAETLRDTNVIQEPFQLQGVSSLEIPIQSITIDLGTLPRYEVPVGPNDESDDDEDWETESDDSEDNESYYSSDD